MTNPAETLEREILKLLGLDENSEAPQTEPHYLARMRGLGVTLVHKRWTATECLYALALEYLSRYRAKPNAELLGRAKQLVMGARALEAMKGDAELIGRALEGVGKA